MKDKRTIRIILHSALSFCILISTFSTTAALNAYASELFFEAANRKFMQSDLFTISVFLDTQGESANAIEGKIIFPPQLLEIREVRDGNSVINFWIERPNAEQTGFISFSGITPGGYQATKGFLFSVAFSTKLSGNGIIEMRNAKVLLDDGKGTQANLKISPFQFFISKGSPAAQPTAKPLEDREPPESFKPEVSQSQYLFDSKWFLVFATQDKGSGISGYEVKEASLRVLAIFSKWQSAVSPHVLEDQGLRSYIYAKAIDKAGNKRISVIAPRYPTPWYKQPPIWVIILAIVFLCLIGKILWEKSIKSR